MKYNPAVHKLRNFFVELILVGVCVGWLIVKYPKLIDSIIPVIVLLIVWHLTWEYILQWRPIKAAAVGFGRRCKPVLAWPLVFIAGGMVSILYWYGISRSLQRLATLEAIREAGKKSNQPSPAVSSPAPKPVAAGRSHTATPILKPPPKSSSPAVIGPRLGIGPEAYKEISDEQVGQWAIEEADKIEELANRAMNYWGGVRAGVSFNAISWRFTNEFNDCCAQDVKELRTEVLRRLGPPAKDPEEIMAWTVLFPELKYPEIKGRMPEIINLESVRDYAPYLRRLGWRLKRRQIPRVGPILLHFSEAKVPPQPPSNFQYNLMVTIKTETKVTAGYIVVEFDHHPGIILCDFVDSKLVLGSDIRLIDNEEVRNYVGNYEPPNYALAIGKTPFTPEKPIHVLASGPEQLGVVKVILFDE